jgi:hypothetical protein
MLRLRHAASDSASTSAKRAKAAGESAAFVFSEKLLITLKVNVVDALFAGLNAIHYLRKVLIFDFQSIAN